MTITPETRMALFNMSHGNENTTLPMQWETFKRVICRPQGIENAIRLAFDQNPSIEIDLFCQILMSDKETLLDILMSE